MYTHIHMYMGRSWITHTATWEIIVLTCFSGTSYLRANEAIVLCTVLYLAFMNSIKSNKCLILWNFRVVNSFDFIHLLVLIYGL